VVTEGQQFIAVSRLFAPKSEHKHIHKSQKIKRNECICHDLETETIEKSFSYRVAASVAAAAAASVGGGRVGCGLWAW